MTWHGMVWYGVVWCGVVWCDVVWCVVWCGMAWHGMVSYGMYYRIDALPVIAYILLITQIFMQFTPEEKFPLIPTFT